ncbi:MAG TPA: glycoside hydrolase family 2 TIM barrel-domain containing protein [Armatimonadota bacterium]|nr:glycoside hydrolase family 2 TIM barrel-domain containing protein [Armatimonadota bacterium]
MKPYPFYPTRRAVNLDGAWEFAWLGEANLPAIDPASLVFDEVEAVPGVFDSGVNRPGARGTGVYRRVIPFAAPAGKTLRLHLGGLGLWGRVWWDGECLGDVELPYSGYTFDITANGAASHELVIAVDNRFDPERTPLFPPYSDFYAYGGIYRSVELEELPSFRVERVRVQTVDLAAARVRLEIRLAGDVPDEVAYRLAFDNGDAESLVARPRDGVIQLERSIPGAQPWTPEHPELHTVQVAVDNDTIIERFGLRTVAAHDGAIWLNGEQVRLRGVNRHEAHPQLGPAQPTALLAEDVRLIKEMGCNFVRAVHYPHTPAFLDLCDQMGLLVWEESMGWQLGEREFTSARARAQMVEQTRRMVSDHINHPSIIFWAFLNESASDHPSAVPVYREITQAIRAEDSTRLVTWASNRHERDRCFEFADVVSLNFYPGWIHPISDWQTSNLTMVAPYLAEMAGFCSRPGLEGKPLLVSEIGACGMYGCHDREHAQWSEEFQADYCDAVCQAILADPRYTGVAFWQFCDTRSYVQAGNIRCKPLGYNYGGLVDRYRRPKLAYDVVAKQFRKVE